MGDSRSRPVPELTPDLPQNPVRPQIDRTSRRSLFATMRPSGRGSCWPSACDCRCHAIGKSAPASHIPVTTSQCSAASHAKCRPRLTIGRGARPCHRCAERYRPIRRIRAGCCVRALDDWGRFDRVSGSVRPFSTRCGGNPVGAERILGELRFVTRSGVPIGVGPRLVVSVRLTACGR